MSVIYGQAITLGGGGNELIVTAPTGSTVTATKDGVTKTATEKNGVWTFKGLEAGEWTVTATKGSDTASAIVTVSAEALTLHYKPTASTTATTGVTYTDGIADLSATIVSLIGEAISNNSAITNTTSTVYVDSGTIHRKISVGDQVSLSLNGTSYAFDIIGFNHDTLTTAAAYGAATTTGKAGITLQMHDCFTTTYPMNAGDWNANGWKESLMRTSTMENMLGYLPDDWEAIIKPVNKASGTGGGSTSGTETVSDSCFLLAEIEVFGSKTYSVSGEGSQYAYYKAGNSKVKTVNGSASWWWERSPFSGNDNYFCGINGGTASGNSATASLGVSFAFCI